MDNKLQIISLTYKTHALNILDLKRQYEHVYQKYLLGKILFQFLHYIASHIARNENKYDL
jgi:hypothetical protein